MVLRDYRGEVLGCQALLKSGHWKASIAEAIRLKEVLSWVELMGLSNVIVEMDVKCIIDEFHGGRENCSELGSIIETCIAKASKIHNFNLKYVSRRRNNVAHNIAKFVIFGNVIQQGCIIPYCVRDLPALDVMLLS